jgi:C-terminal of Roc, COR, domain/Ras of Complex, Roc, domain of DAPkinase
MDREEFRQHIRAQLRKLPKEASSAFAARMALRVLPLLAWQGNDDASVFSFWPKRKRAQNLFAIFASCNIAGLVGCGEKNMREAALGAKDTVANDHLPGNFARAYVHALRTFSHTSYAAYAAAVAEPGAAPHPNDPATFAADAAVAAIDAWGIYCENDLAKDGDCADYSVPVDCGTDIEYDYDDYGDELDQVSLLVDIVDSDLKYLISDQYSATAFHARRLWSNSMDNQFQSDWQDLSLAVKQLDPGFAFWLDFYQDRLDGKPLDLSLLRQAALLPESLKTQGVPAINAHLLNLRNELAVKPLNRVRAIFIGYGDAGKTSLVRVLHDEPVKEGREPMTPGIEIREWPVPATAIKAHFWDFGGQVMVHATHQLFLRESCLYVLVISARAEINATEQAQYWLEHVKSFGKDAPVIIVGNRADQTTLNLDMGVLTEKYPNIINYFPLSCTRAQAEFKPQADAFKMEFCRQLQALTTHQMMFTVQQFAVLQKLRERTPKLAFLSRQAFVDLCAEQQIDEKGVQNRAWLLDILDKLGVIIHFKQLSLSDGYVLNPRWLTYGIYTLMYHQRARLSQTDIVELLRKEEVCDEEKNVLDYPPEKCRFIMEAMREFKLCYSLPDQPQTLIVPSLLPATQPALDFAKADALAFELAFAVFLPRHVMPELIVARHHEIGKNAAWQAGVVLEYTPHDVSRHDARALLVADYLTRKLQIWVEGSEARDYLILLRDEIRRILSRIVIDYTERLMLPHAARISQASNAPGEDRQTAAPYNQILAHAKKGVMTYIAESGDEYDVAAVLRLFITKREGEKQIGPQIIQNIYGDNAQVTAKKESTGNKTVKISGSKIDNVVVADKLTNSFNQSSTPAITPAVQNLLAQLQAAIASLKQTAPSVEVDNMATDTQTMTAELAKSTPRAKTLGNSLEGIREAAQAKGGDSVRPILATVAQLAAAWDV